MNETQTLVVVPAQAPAGEQPGLMDGLMQSAPMLLLIVGVFYFLVIRPQTKQRQEREQMLSTLKKGDDIVTEGGIVGVVHEVGEDIVVVQVADKVKMRFKKASVEALDAKPTKEEG